METEAARKKATELRGAGTELLERKISFGRFGSSLLLAESKSAYRAGGLPSRLDQPSWQGRGVQRTTGIGRRGTFRHTGTRLGEVSVTSSGGGQGGGGELLIAALACYLAYLPVGTAVGAINGQSLEHAMASFSDDFLAALREQQPLVGLLNDSVAALPTGPLEGTGSGPPLACEVSLVRAELVECKPRGTFCLELAARYVWRRQDTGERVLDRIVSSTHPDSFLPGRYPVYDRSYEKVVFASPSHKLDELRGRDGAKLLAADAPAILKAIARGLAEEWAVPSPAPASAAATK